MEEKLKNKHSLVDNGDISLQTLSLHLRETLGSLKVFLVMKCGVKRNVRNGEIFPDLSATAVWKN